MTYIDDEKSIADAQPVELYKFVGTYANYLYTSGPQSIDYDDGSGDVDITYEAITIERSEVRTGTHEDDGLNITVKMSPLQTVVQDYGFTVSPPKLKLIIYRVEPGGTIIYWTGPVNNVQVDEDGRASLMCPSVLGNALVGNVPHVFYQTPCNHVLYDSRCGVDFAANSNVTTITAISADGRTISVASIAALDGKLLGGELDLGTGERRMIVAQTGTDITVNFPYARATVGGACTIAAGCDLAYDGDCKNKFNNQIRHGGFMCIPPINPFADGIEPAAAGVTDDACVFVPPAPVDYWAKITWEFDVGFTSPDPLGIGDDFHVSRPHRPPGWGLQFYRGGVHIPAADMVSADNYTDHAFTTISSVDYQTSMTTYYFLPSTAIPRGPPGFATDPFGGVDPDDVQGFFQFDYFAFSPEYYAGHGGGLMRFTFERVGGLPLVGTVVVGDGAAPAYVGTQYIAARELYAIGIELTL